MEAVEQKSYISPQTEIADSILVFVNNYLRKMGGGEGGGGGGGGGASPRRQKKIFLFAILKIFIDTIW